MTERAPVTTLELFFDLVFVFALTQVTDLMSDGPSARGIVRGLLIMAVLWSSWVGYAWLANVVQAVAGITRVSMSAAMTAMFILALTIPEAFEDAPGGLSGSVVFALGYFAVRPRWPSGRWPSSGTTSAPCSAGRPGGGCLSPALRRAARPDHHRAGRVDRVQRDRGCRTAYLLPIVGSVAMPTPTCTCPWRPASCCSRYG